MQQPDTNLVRMEAVAKTDEPSVAYLYTAGLKGFAIGPASRVAWRDVARNWQKVEFGGSPNDDPVALRARNRPAIVESEGGSVAVFPAPHKFFFAREIELNLACTHSPTRLLAPKLLHKQPLQRRHPPPPRGTLRLLPSLSPKAARR
jgi:hypothetical protein